MGLLSKLLQKRMKDPVDGTAHVVGISFPDATATSENYRMDCVVSGPGIEPKACVHTGYAKVGLWPSPGDDIPIVIDRSNPDHFVIQWDRLTSGHDQAMAQAEALAAQMRAGTPAGASMPTVQEMSLAQALESAGPVPTFKAADVLASGLRGSATLRGTFPTDQQSPQADHTMIGLMLAVTVDGHPPYETQGLFNTPTAKLAKLTPGAMLPIAALPDQLQVVAVDWDRV